jgi:hypothetical protein
MKMDLKCQDSKVTQISKEQVKVLLLLELKIRSLDANECFKDQNEDIN